MGNKYQDCGSPRHPARRVNHHLPALLAVFVLLLFAPPSGCSKEKGKQKIRRPAVAGAFYPADAAELTKMIDGFLARAQVPKITGRVYGVVSPHAGYVFSGGVAAYSYALLKGRKIKRVVIIAPSHVEAFSFTSVYNGDAYATPLGVIGVDKAFASKLAGMGSSIKLSGRGHDVSGRRGEHSLEVQLPFLQRVLGEFQIVPIVMGDQSYEHCRDLGFALAKLIQGPDTVIVASSDLSHFHTYDQAVKLDHKTLRAIQEWDYLSMARNFATRVWEACGGGPIIATMIASERMGANEARLLKYANSGDVTGDHSRVVGYGSLAFLKSPGKSASTGPSFTLGNGEKKALLAIARKSVETAVRQHKLYECDDAGYASLDQERGAFVTLKKKGRLRGCIGYVAPRKPLYITVRDVAAYAAMQDPRFRPVQPAELKDLQYEISVLSPLRRVLDIKHIEVGKHGLVIRKASREGLLLPQVPVEEGWDRMTFLRHTCLKAGLDPQAWRDKKTDIFYFTALVFGDHDTGRPVTSSELRGGAITGPARVPPSGSVSP